MTTEDIYQAPESDVVVEEASPTAPFYVVSMNKFTLLFFITLGSYLLYWFYQNWRLVKEREGLSIWPVPRAIFSIFFTHTLFERVEQQLSHREGVTWNGSLMATLYVLFSITSSVLDRLSFNEIGSPTTDILSLLILIPLWQIVASAQRKVNLVCDDEQGTSNSSLTAVNWIFILLGAVLWLLVIVGLLMYADINAFDV